MKLRPWLLCASPLALVAGCLLPSFENVPADSEPQGGADGNAGAGATSAVGGEPQGGAPAGGTGNVPSVDEPQPTSDTYVLEQGTALLVAAADGVLANDVPSGLSVSAFDDADPDRPGEFDATVTIESDGAFSFEPAAAFFGRYVVSYTVENEVGDTAQSSVTFVVQPTGVELDSVAAGVGGVLLTGGAGDALGSKLAALGDVNDDGYDDFAIGALGAAAGDGAIYVVFGRSDFGALTLGALAPSSTEDRFAVLEGSAGLAIGSSVDSAGRFNADEIPDIVVGAPGATGGDGKIFVVNGGVDLKAGIALATLPNTAGITISGRPAGEQLGLLATGGGDFNGDAKADLLSGIYPGGLTTGGVCAILENPVASAAIEDLNHPTMPDSGVNYLPEGLTFVGDVNDDGKGDLLAASRRHVALVFGQGDGQVPTTIATVSTDQLGLLRTRPSPPSGKASLAAAGDVNQDGKADFAFCDEFAGEARCLVFLKAVTLADTLATGQWTLEGFAGSPVPPLLGNGADLNQDGFADLVVADQSAAYVIFGRDAGFGAVDVTSLGTDGFSLSTATPGSLSAIASIGDVNGDGYGDLAIGERSAATGSGAVYVVFGGPFAAEQR